MREVAEEEVPLSHITGARAWPIWQQERLRNEASMLEYIASHTTIPVPKGRLYTKNGLLHLETTLVGLALAMINERTQQRVLSHLNALQSRWRRIFCRSFAN